MDMEHAAIKHATGDSFKSQLKERFRQAEILGWYLCYKLVARSRKENPAKSLNS